MLIPLYALYPLLYALYAYNLCSLYTLFALLVRQLSPRHTSNNNTLLNSATKRLLKRLFNVQVFTM